MIGQLREILLGKVVIACVGNDFKGDDAAGPMLAKELAGKTRAEVIDCQQTPENYLDKIKDAKPDTIIFVDAVNMNMEPGSLSIIGRDKLAEMQVYTTHNIPLKVIADYLFLETKAHIFLLGIQAEAVALGSCPSKKVAQTVDFLKDNLSTLLKK